MSWFRKPLNIAVTVGAAVLAIGCIALITYGVLTHREPGLLEVCWEESAGGGAKVAHYVSGNEVNDGPCEGSEKLVWPQGQIPLTIAAIAPDRLTPIKVGSGARESIDQATFDINRQLGFDLYQPVDDPARASVVVEVGVPVDASVDGEDGGGEAGTQKARFGRVWHYRHQERNRMFCRVVLYANLGSLRHQYLVAHHELLHCPALAHDPDDESSAMYPFTNDDSMWARMQAARITDYDRELLRGIYYKRQVDSSEGSD